MGTTLNEVAGLEKVQIEIGGKKYQATRPSLRKIWGLMEQMAKDDVYTDILALADKAGYEGGERIRFIRELFDSMPRGNKMENLIAGRMQTVDGMITILRSIIVDVKEEDVTDIVLNDIEGALAAIEILCSVPGQEKNAVRAKA